ncbi:MAG: protein kinase [Isosphaerales bacterium]
MADETGQGQSQEQRVNEVMAAYVQAAEAGQAPDRKELVTRHPDLAAELESFLADYDRVNRLAEPLREVARAAQAEDIGGVGPLGSLAEQITAGAVASDSDPTQPLNGLSHPPAAGARIRYFGDYELTGEIARGGMGIVYRARQISLNRPVALKMILAGKLASEADVQRFRNEAEAVANLDHPGIVPIHEVGLHEGLTYFSMKLIEGGSLAERLGEFTADPRAAAKLLAAAARAVHHAHQRGVLHRDLKPSNILVDRQGQPHVSDFGLAKRVEADPELTQSGAILGSPPYIAPEQTTGRRGAITVATDVYGLGAVLYAMLAGRPPFRADSVQETIEQVRQREPEPPSGFNHRVDRDLQTICLKCLSKDPQRRFGSAQELVEDLERWLRGEPIAARPVTRAERGWRWCRRNPVVALLTGLVAALVLVGVAGLAVSNLSVARERDAARAQRRRAEAHFRQARDAVDQMLTEVGQTTLADVPQLEPVRRALLLKALAFYREFLRDRPSEPSVRLEAGRAYRRAGDINVLLGRHTEAEDALRRSIDLLAGLAPVLPGSGDRREELARSRHSLGELLKTTGRAAMAEPELREALALRQALADRSPSPEHRQDLAESQMAIGRWLREAGRPAEAGSAFREALQLHEALAAKDPDQPEHRYQVGMTLNSLAVLEGDQGRYAEARQYVERAVAQQEAALKADPRNPRYRFQLAQQLKNLGTMLLALKEYEKAKQPMDQALEVSRGLVDDFPHVPKYRNDLARSHNNLAVLLNAGGDPRTALAECRQALDLDEALATEFPGVPEYRVDLGRASAFLGQLLHASGRPGEAVAAYLRAIELLESQRIKTPGNPDIVPILGMVEDAVARLLLKPAYPKVRDPATAVRHALKATELMPGNAVYWGTLGGAYYRVGRWAECIEALQKSMQSDSVVINHGSRDLYLAVAHWQRGDTEEARRWYDRGVEEIRAKGTSDERLRLRDEATALLGKTP